ncbi:holo-ACP synthase [Paenibacillus sp. 1001270B_150601_E10]|uniref:holo-ACP synthase n=1 Tax=Paenibacillus sp. 1001270B_150601_E10 TaxID=2787079 RepID=UPI00189CA03B|nr:holo-ACP synthase [Paenibacillus sp. 1001270B_150601_E10]
MIYGVGHDILEQDRVKSILESSSGDRFLQKIMTEKERELLADRGPRRIEYTAGRFAVKEAVVKAFGCGISSQIGFQDIEVLPDSLGKPVAVLSPGAWERLGLDSNEMQLHVSISHQPGLASAFCIVEKLA